MRKKIRLIGFLKSTVILVFALLLIALGGWCFRFSIMKFVLELCIERTVGVPAEIGNFSYDSANHTFHLTDFNLHNPEGFGPDLLAQIPEASGTYDPRSLLEAKLRLPKLDVKVLQFVIVRNEKGELNVDVLKVVKEEIKQKKRTGILVKPLEVDVLKLSMEKVVLKTLRKDKKPLVEAIDVNLKDKVYKGIQGETQLTLTIVLQAVQPFKLTLKAAVILGVGAATGGVGLIPAAAAIILLGNDSATAEYEMPPGPVYEAAVAVMEETGEVRNKDPGKRRISGRATGSNVNISISRKKKDGRTRLVVTARDLLIPKPGYASGIVYEIDRKVQGLARDAAAAKMTPEPEATKKGTKEAPPTPDNTSS